MKFWQYKKDTLKFLKKLPEHFANPEELLLIAHPEIVYKLEVNSKTSPLPQQQF